MRADLYLNTDARRHRSLKITTWSWMR